MLYPPPPSIISSVQAYNFVWQGQVCLGQVMGAKLGYRGFFRRLRGLCKIRSQAKYCRTRHTLYSDIVAIQGLLYYKAFAYYVCRKFYLSHIFGLVALQGSLQIMGLHFRNMCSYLWHVLCQPEQSLFFWLFNFWSETNFTANKDVESS